jgi:hypothetical protein
MRIWDIFSYSRTPKGRISIWPEAPAWISRLLFGSNDGKKGHSHRGDSKIF